LLLFGTVFALQGADVMKGSSVMSGNSTYIYVGAVLDVLGLVLILGGARSRFSSPSGLTTDRSDQSGAAGSTK
jgi:hypothetical protein